jgi:hypothetical protein
MWRQARSAKSDQGETAMNAKDTVIGTTKRLVAEIVGDGALADEGSRQANGNAPVLPSGYRSAELGRPSGVDTSVSNAAATTEHDGFALLLGRAALSEWPDLPRDAQERLFAAAVDAGLIANSLAVFLHDRHPKTAHPPHPTQIA